VRKNFDFIAPFYDKLSRMVFGRAMHSAQTAYLQQIVQGGNVLILGGGTGWLLSELLTINPTCRVWYVEASQSMIKFAKTNTEGRNNDVMFIHGTEDDLPGGVVFDAVITHFFFDLFSTAKCGRIVARIRPAIHPKTIWLVSDFVNTTWWHSAMLVAMYRFFKVVSGIEANSLPDWQNAMVLGGFREINSEETYGRFIRSGLFVAEGEAKKNFN
jgi:tRNA (cmo5U34)-methyltransferase